MRRLLPLTAALLVLACGDEQPNEDAQVRTAVQTFATAVEQRDYQTLCDEVFAPELLEGLQQIGLPCEVAMQTSLGEVREPKLTVGEIAVDGTTATAEIRTSAKGQPPSTDTLELEKLSGRWKVTALDEEKSPTPARSPRPSPSATASP